MSPKPKNKSNKRAFDGESGLKRDTMWVASPEALCIIGGKKMPAEERGPLDTDDGEERLLYDPRIFDPISEEFVSNIDFLGVDTPIIIAKIDGVPVVIVGKTRVRAARIANRRRKKRGEPLISINCKIKRGSEIELYISMVVENEQRRDDDVPAKTEKLKRLMNKGVAIETCARIFKYGVPTLKGWIAYEDNAIKETKRAVETHKISHTAGATIAKIKDPEKQREKLAEVIANAAATGGRVSRRVAKLAARGAGAVQQVGITDKKTQKRLLEVVQDTSHPNAGKETLAWWSGVEAALMIVIGLDDVDPRLTGKLDETIALLKTEQRAKLQQKAAKEAEKAERDQAKAMAEQNAGDEDDENDDEDEAAEAA